jgi:hypothetical protein
MFRHLRRATVGVAMLAALVVPAVSGAAPLYQADVLPSTVSGIHVASSLHMQGGRISDLATAQRLATTRDDLFLTVGQLNGYAAAMHQANPNLRLFLYVNGMFSQQNQGSTFPAGWYMHAADGTKIQSRGYGNFLMDPRGRQSYTAGGQTYTGWSDYVARSCRAQLVQSGADGCFLDMLGTGPLSAEYNVGGEVPVVDSSGAHFTNMQWYQQITGPVATLAEQVSGKPVIANGIGNGRRYYGGSYGPSNQILQTATGGDSEIWMRSPSSSITKFPTDAAWRTEVQMLSDSSIANRAILATVKTWTTATQAQLEQWRRFTLASFLIGNQGHAMFEFSPATKMIWTDSSPLYSLAIGSPLETYAGVAGYLKGGVYQRAFAAGKVIANPSGSAVTVSLGGVYRTVGGALVTQVTVPAHDGAILTI